MSKIFWIVLALLWINTNRALAADQQTLVSYSAAAQCGGGWNTSAIFEGDEAETLILLRQAVLNGNAYYELFTTDVEFVKRTNFTGSQAGLPDPQHEEYLWTGTDLDGFTIWTLEGGTMSNLPEHWGGEIEVYQQENGNWEYRETHFVGVPPYPGSCAKQEVTAQLLCPEMVVEIMFENQATAPEAPSVTYQWTAGDNHQPDVTVAPSQAVTRTIQLTQDQMMLIKVQGGFGFAREFFFVGDCTGSEEPLVEPSVELGEQCVDGATSLTMFAGQYDDVIFTFQYDDLDTVGIEGVDEFVVGYGGDKELIVYNPKYTDEPEIQLTVTNNVNRKVFTAKLHGCEERPSQNFDNIIWLPALANN